MPKATDKKQETLTEKKVVIEEGEEPQERQDENVTSEAQDQLRGSVGGVQGILSIQEKVSQGITQYDSAIAILKSIYGFTTEEAEAILGTPIQEFSDDQQTVEQ